MSAVSVTPVVVVDRWQDAAECRLYAEDMWAEGASAVGRAVCAACPVNDACLLDALAYEYSGEQPGHYRMWGGLTANQRKQLGAPWPSLVESARSQVRAVTGR